MRDAGLSIKAWMDINDNDYERVTKTSLSPIFYCCTYTQCRDALDGYVKWTGIVQHKTDANCDVRWQLGEVLSLFHLLLQDWAKVHNWGPGAIWWRMVQVIFKIDMFVDKIDLSTKIDPRPCIVQKWTNPWQCKYGTNKEIFPPFFPFINKHIAKFDKDLRRTVPLCEPWHCQSGETFWSVTFLFVLYFPSSLCGDHLVCCAAATSANADILPPLIWQPTPPLCR